MGVVSPVGLSVQESWETLMSGRSGIRPITAFDPAGFDVQIAGEVQGFDPSLFMTAKEARRMDRFSQFALAALEQALAQSGLEVGKADPYRIGVMVGSGVGGIATYTRELAVLEQKGPQRVSPFLIPSITTDVPSVQIAIRTGAQGPNFGMSSACATSTDAVGLALAAIQRGDCDAVFTGGFEAAVTPIGVAAFDRMQALSHRNDHPQAASRPFDLDRDGFVIAEGGALLVLEELAAARQHGAEPLAEVLGYAATSDAAYIAAPEEQGASAGKCLTLAMERAGVQPEQVSYINAHGTSTPMGDAAETRAIKYAFGPNAYQIPVSSTKSMTGHMLGGAGAFEIVVCVQTIRNGAIPPTINLTVPDPDCDLDYVPNTAREADLAVVVSNSMGFGGHNASIIISAWEEGWARDE
jgi:beta-ketoacyl-acyl-carrier-protein synthase II